MEIVKELAPFAHRHGTQLLLEPFNRCQQHLLRRQSDAIEIIQTAGDPRWALARSVNFIRDILETLD